MAPPLPSSALEVDPISTNDLCELPAVTPEDVLRILRARALEGMPYTQVSPRLLVSVNPHQYVQANSDAVLAEYRDYGTDTTLEPHIWVSAALLSAVRSLNVSFPQTVAIESSVLLHASHGAGSDYRPLVSSSSHHAKFEEGGVEIPSLLRSNRYERMRNDEEER